MLQIAQFTRKPFIVEAVQVTAENMFEVAAWCKGEIKKAPDGKQYIKVEVARPMHERQTMAFVKNWVLSAETGFKVFGDKPFVHSYQEFLEPACGLTTLTADGKPCVLGKGHRTGVSPVGCRSLQDYKFLAPIISHRESRENQITSDPNLEVM